MMERRGKDEEETKESSKDYLVRDQLLLPWLQLALLPTLPFAFNWKKSKQADTT